MNIKSISIFLLGVSLLMGCASSSIQDRQLTAKEADETEILGSVQTNFALMGINLPMVVLPPPSNNIKGQAYSKLLEEARRKYNGNIDVKNINISQSSKKFTLMGYEYSYTASGNVISTSATTRVAGKLGGITDQIINAFVGNKKARIAIFEFVNINGKKSVLGRYLVEQISNYFFQNSGLEIIERAQIDKVLDEQNFGMSGYVSDESAVRIGHILGANAVTIGTLTKVGSKISVNIKIVDTETASLLSSGSTEIDGVEYIEMYNELLE